MAFCTASTSYIPTIFAPNGVSDNFAILKNCLPKGMPTIVKHQRNPRIRLPIAIHMPKKITQITFAIKDGAPPPYTTSLPNGKKERLANLKHCFPYGNPIIVMHQNNPEINQANPLIKPPNANHKMLPIVPISFLQSFLPLPLECGIV